MRSFFLSIDILPYQYINDKMCLVLNAKKIYRKQNSNSLSYFNYISNAFYLQCCLWQYFFKKKEASGLLGSSCLSTLISKVQSGCNILLNCVTFTRYKNNE